MDEGSAAATCGEIAEWPAPAALIPATISESCVAERARVKFASTGMANPPSMGVTYSSRFLPAKGSYLELN